MCEGCRQRVAERAVAPTDGAANGRKVAAHLALVCQRHRATFDAERATLHYCAIVDELAAFECHLTPGDAQRTSSFSTVAQEGHADEAYSATRHVYRACGEVFKDATSAAQLGDA